MLGRSAAPANQELLRELRRIHQGPLRIYGSPRMQEAWVARGFRYSPNRVARLMRADQIRAQLGRSFRRPPPTRTAATWLAPNVLAGRFQAAQLNQVWWAEIPYIPTQSGWLYLAAVMDLCSRRSIGWSMSSQSTAQLSLDALHMALLNRPPQAQGVLHPSERGIHSACRA